MSEDSSQAISQCLDYAIAQDAGELRMAAGTTPTMEVSKGNFVPIGSFELSESDLIVFLLQNFREFTAADVYSNEVKAGEFQHGGQRFRVVKRRVNDTLVLQFVAMGPRGASTPRPQGARPGRGQGGGGDRPTPSADFSRRGGQPGGPKEKRPTSAKSSATPRQSPSGRHRAYSPAAMSGGPHAPIRPDDGESVKMSGAGGSSSAQGATRLQAGKASPPPAGVNPKAPKPGSGAESNDAGGKGKTKIYHPPSPPEDDDSAGTKGLGVDDSPLELSEEAEPQEKQQSMPAAPSLRVSGDMPQSPASRSGSGGDKRHKIDLFLEAMVAKDASDIHFHSGLQPRIRVHGAMTLLDEAPVLSRSELEQLLRPIMPERSVTQYKQKRDTDFGYEIAGTGRFRVNVLCDRRGIGAVLRLIPSEVPTCEELGFDDAIKDLANLSKGLILVTGPTGSGKSTTLAALVNRVNERRTEHIITIEDPIEFVHDNKKCLVTQREVGQHTADFKVALRAALREDPDIVLIGELRDLETTAIAIETAETGHLVFGTLHTNTATSTVDRIIGQFPGEFQEQIRMMLSETLRAVISQTLCRRKSGGRVAAMEVLLHNRAVANLVREGKTFQIPSVIQTNRNIGMRMLNDSLFDLVAEGTVEPTEAYIRSFDKDELKKRFQAKGIRVE